jgi:lipoprotein-releasing system ATP-binding protein
LLSILGTLDTPDKGSVRLNNIDPFSLSPGKLAHFRNQSIGFVFQDHHLLPQLTALENTLLPTLAGDKINQDELKTAAIALLEKMGLKERLHHFPYQLSGGECQRVAIARALIQKPLLILADEPTGNLDTGTAKQVGDLLLETCRVQEAILLAVTHNEDFAKRFGEELKLR